MDITVITPSVEGRSKLLVAAHRSVMLQTLQPKRHDILFDDRGRGPAALRNSMMEIAETDYLAFLDDDDLLDPHHLETLSASTADVVIPYCRFSDRTIPSNYCNRPYDREALRKHGIFPITVLAKREAILDAGGFGDERYEDWALWNRMADNGCSFEVIPIITWTYRLGHGNRTYS